MSALELARAAFRDASKTLDPETLSSPPTAAIVKAWLCVQTVRTQPKWIRAAADAVQALDPAAVPQDAVAEWLEACCRGWVQQAIGPFRNTGRALLGRLPERTESAAALFGWWRITGERDAMDRALSLLTSAEHAVDPGLAVALRLAFHATADQGYFARAKDALGEHLDTLSPTAWATAIDLQGLDVAAFTGALGHLDTSSPSGAAQAVLGAAALALPPLHLEAQWFMEDELREGPMAEAATFPWEALRLRFSRLDVRDQIHFTARFADGDPEELEDIGVVTPWLELLVGRTDRGPLLDGAPPRTRRRGGLRRSR